MNDILDVEIILKRNKYPKIYSIGIIMINIIIICLYVIFTYKYQTYYISKGKIINNKLELLVNINDLIYIKNNNTIEIDNQIYTYKLESINQELYTDDSYNNYQYVYLKVFNLSNIDNYVYEVKIPKENKILAKYIKNYL